MNKQIASALTAALLSLVPVPAGASTDDSRTVMLRTSSATPIPQAWAGQSWYWSAVAEQVAECAETEWRNYVENARRWNPDVTTVSYTGCWFDAASHQVVSTFTVTAPAGTTLNEALTDRP